MIWFSLSYLRLFCISLSPPLCCDFILRWINRTNKVCLRVLFPFTVLGIDEALVQPSCSYSSSCKLSMFLFPLYFTSSSTFLFGEVCNCRPPSKHFPAALQSPKNELKPGDNSALGLCWDDAEQIILMEIVPSFFVSLLWALLLVPAKINSQGI